MSPGADSERRVVVFTGARPTVSTIETIEAMVRRLPSLRLLVVCADRQRPPRAWLRTRLRRLAREPFSYPVELLTQAAAHLRPVGRRTVTGAVRLPALTALNGVEVRSFADVHGADCAAAVRAFAPWLGVGIGPPLLRPELFRLPELGTLNLHKSLLPDYRGMPPGFWELHDGAANTGVSVHWMEASLDAGALLCQRPLTVPAFATPAGLLARLDELGIDVLVQAIDDLLLARATERPQGRPTTAVRSRPPFLLARRVRRRCERARRQAHGVRAAGRDLLKSAVLGAFVHAWAPLRNLWRRARGGCHTTMLLYHRVSDEFLDSVTVGVGQFQRQLDLLRRHYDVLDLDTWLRRHGERRRRPAVVLTFDDGYADNHLAAMLLRRRGLPCTFFVCTRIVGSDDAFPQDQRKLGRRVPALSWQQIHEMAAWNFTFANHTTDHTDVAQLPTPEALARVQTAAADLTAQLGNRGPERWLAYPYGRRQNMREDIRAALPTAGVDYCFSAYGGVNPPDFDRWNIVRQGVNFAVTDLALRAVVEGWRQAKGGGIAH